MYSHKENTILTKPVINDDLSNEPVSLSDIKSYASITFSDKDVVLQALAVSARKQLENITGLSFGEKTITATVFHAGDITEGLRLPGGPIDTLDKVQWRSSRFQTYTDITSSTTLYEMEGDKFYTMQQGFYILDYTTQDWDLGADLITAIKAQTQYLYEAVGDETKSGKICEVAQALIEPYICGDLLL